MRHRLVLLDLDGTLLDTAPDMAGALNTLLMEEGRAALPFDRIRPVVSHGARCLIALGFELTAGSREFDRLNRRFLDLYSAGLARATSLFPGMADVLQTIEAAGVPWGIVTNKPAWLTEPLLQRLNLFTRAICIVSGDSTSRRKPHPDPVVLACRIAAVSPNHAVYVGDADRDVQAGRAAGTETVVATYGYIGTGERPECWGADALVESPAALLRWLRSPRAAVQTPAGEAR